MRIAVRVFPRSRQNVLEWEQHSLKARLTAPPVDGAANEALVALLAERLDISRRSITIVRGAISRHKMVEIAGMTMEQVKQKLGTGQ